MRRLGFRSAVTAALVAAALVLPATARAGECHRALGELARDMDNRAGPILGPGPVFAPDRKTELRRLIRSLALAAENMNRRGDDEGCLQYVAEARGKLRLL